MIPFFELMQEALDESSAVVSLQKVHQAFNILLYTESDEDLIIDTDMIKALDQARLITESFVALPEIEDTDYLNDVLETMDNSLAGFLQDQLDVRDLWDATVALARLIHALHSALNYFITNNIDIGVSTDPAISVAIGENGSVQLYGKVDSTDGLSMDDAAALQKEFDKRRSDKNSTPTQLINIASRLLTSQRFEEAIQAFESIIERFPAESPSCLNAIGACHFYMQRYEKAIEVYMQALKAGEAIDRVEYNVWESCDALVKTLEDTNQRMKWNFFFKEYFPNSKLKLTF